MARLRVWHNITAIVLGLQQPTLTIFVFIFKSQMMVSYLVFSFHVIILCHMRAIAETFYILSCFCFSSFKFVQLGNFTQNSDEVPLLYPYISFPPFQTLSGPAQLRPEIEAEVGPSASCQSGGTVSESDFISLWIFLQPFCRVDRRAQSVCFLDIFPSPQLFCIIL